MCVQYIDGGGGGGGGGGVLSTLRGYPEYIGHGGHLDPIGGCSDKLLAIVWGAFWSTLGDIQESILFKAVCSGFAPMY